MPPVGCVMQDDQNLAQTAERDIETALIRARRVAANLSDADDRRVIEQYVAELENLLEKRTPVTRRN